MWTLATYIAAMGAPLIDDTLLLSELLQPSPSPIPSPGPIFHILDSWQIDLALFPPQPTEMESE